MLTCEARKYRFTKSPIGPTENVSAEGIAHTREKTVMIASLLAAPAASHLSFALQGLSWLFSASTSDEPGISIIDELTPRNPTIRAMKAPFANDGAGYENGPAWLALRLRLAKHKLVSRGRSPERDGSLISAERSSRRDLDIAAAQNDRDVMPGMVM
jgi:hypothetical protein